MREEPKKVSIVTYEQPFESVAKAVSEAQTGFLLSRILFSGQAGCRCLHGVS